MRCVCGNKDVLYFNTLNLLSVETHLGPELTEILSQPEPITVYVCQKCGTIKAWWEEE